MGDDSLNVNGSQGGILSMRNPRPLRLADASTGSGETGESSVEPAGNDPTGGSSVQNSQGSNKRLLWIGGGFVANLGAFAAYFNSINMEKIPGEADSTPATRLKYGRFVLNAAGAIMWQQGDRGLPEKTSKIVNRTGGGVGGAVVVAGIFMEDNTLISVGGEVVANAGASWLRREVGGGKKFDAAHLGAAAVLFVGGALLCPGPAEVSEEDMYVDPGEENPYSGRYFGSFACRDLTQGIGFSQMGAAFYSLVKGD